MSRSHSSAVAVLAVIASLLACNPAASKHPAGAAQSPPSTAAASCDPAGLATAATGVAQTDARTDAFAVAAGLRLACGDRLPPAARLAFEEVERHQPDPAHVAALPERVDQLVDLSSCSDAERQLLADAYAQLRRDARHRVSTRIRVIEARGGMPARDDDVEVAILPEAIELDGAAVPDLGALESRLREQTRRARLVLVVDHDQVTFERLRSLVRVANHAGFPEIGVLVVHDGHYRVLPLPRAAERKHAIAVFVEEDGFFIARPGEPASPGREPEVPAAKLGAPLDDEDRWDFESLAQRVDAWSSAESRPWASLSAIDDVWVRDLVRTAAEIRGPACAHDGDAKCKVAGLEWVL